MATKRNRLIELRDARGWRQKDVAEKLGITESYYGMIEAGVRTPNLRLGLRIASLFGVSPNELFFDHETNKLLVEDDESVAKDEQAAALEPTGTDQ